VRAHRIEVPTPGLDDHASFGERVEDLAVEQFIAQVGFAPERLKKIGLRYAEELKRLPAVRSHLTDS